MTQAPTWQRKQEKKLRFPVPQAAGSGIKDARMVAYMSQMERAVKELQESLNLANGEISRLRGEVESYASLQPRRLTT